MFSRGNSNRERGDLEAESEMDDHGQLCFWPWSGEVLLSLLKKKSGTREMPAGVNVQG